MGNQMRLLSKPETDCEFESGTGKAFTYTAAAMQGWRKYQEDRYVCIPDFYDGCSFFGVFDGHGGSEVAEFLKRRLHLEIQDSLQSEFDIELALHSGFLSCDASLREPANIAELNDLVEEENRGALQILRNQESVDADMSEAAEEQAGPSGGSTSTENLYNAGSGAVNQVFFQGIIPSSSPENENSQQDADEMMQVERPLHYLLSDDIEPSDPGDEDYVEAEEISSASEESAESEEEEPTFLLKSFSIKRYISLLSHF
ncbi:Protein phosphatase 2C 1 like protein [Argiope bruennichi]|uniref:protein-serine/threonine phosphatase n=1 Tax=Argiope bruennichi TaxID=94029 RepID=A0A8T0F3G3_ARGBR|nr:Protein phosphatase 2C 1 like protein [Argiope bruennichi]